MENLQINPESRLIVQLSIPFEDFYKAELFYNMLKEMAVAQSPKSTVNGQIMKMLEPCCKERKPTP